LTTDGARPPRGSLFALNAGSSSLKFALYRHGLEPELMVRGEVEEVEREARVTARDASGTVVESDAWGEHSGFDRLMPKLLEWIESRAGGKPVAVGHRIVHGGPSFAAPIWLTPESIGALRALTPLAPLHQPLSLAPVDAISVHWSDVKQVACFDTGFHHRLRPPVSRYALPLSYEAKGIRRYGFHGLSYEFIATRLRQISLALFEKRTVVAHLGSGASLCAMRAGESVDTTMGFSALDGLVMGTRPGTIDPGILLYLLQQEHMSPTDLEDLLYRHSGLAGVSGISGDVRVLLESEHPAAREAIDLFVLRIAQNVAAMAATLGGLEALVFTGGIGEHSDDIRAMVANRLGWLGVMIYAEANRKGGGRIDAPESAVEVWIIPTDEELTIARQLTSLLPDQHSE